jgi:hypothetical protein
MMGLESENSGKANYDTKLAEVIEEYKMLAWIELIFGILCTERKLAACLVGLALNNRSFYRVDLLNLLLSLTLVILFFAGIGSLILKVATSGLRYQA